MAQHVDLKPVLPISRTGGRPLFASSEGILYSFHHGTYHPLRPQYTSGPKSKKNGRRKQIYYKMSDRYGNILVHHAVALAWVGNQPGPEYVIDHLNGITTDNRPSNLQWVTPAENDRRTPYIRALREKIPMHWQTFTREDYLAWFAMPLEDFKAILATLTPGDPHEIMLYEMTHHMEC